MLENIKNTVASAESLFAWLIRQAELSKMGKKAQRRLRRGAKGAKAEARVKHNLQVVKAKAKKKARNRRKATRAMKQRLWARAA